MEESKSTEYAHAAVLIGLGIAILLMGFYFWSGGNIPFKENSIKREFLTSIRK